MLRVNVFYQFIFIIILTCVIAGCQPANPPILAAETSLSSVTPLESVTPRPALALHATNTPNAISNLSNAPTQAEIVAAPPTSTPLIFPTIPQPQPTQAPIMPPRHAPRHFETVIGYSAGGSAITARRFGEGAQVLLLVGGIHGGWEANTVTLMDELIAHFEANPSDILPNSSLILIRLANPDGLPHGRTPQGRFNANGVDLNRNWGCGWSADAVWRDAPVNAGAQPFSEPETQVLSNYIMSIRPSVALFYHSAAGGVFSGGCEGSSHSQAMAAILGEATGYSYGQPFSAYPVTGTAPAWLDSVGIPSADVELFTTNESEFNRNLRGIMALQRWITNPHAP